jgi:hypothetical protein
VQETLDPRIENVMPILSKLQKQVSEMKETVDLAEWADSLIEGEGGPEASEEPIFTEPVETLPADGADAPASELNEREETLDDVIARHKDAVENFKQGGDMGYDLESDLWDYYFTNGEIRNYDADASEFISTSLADYLGIDEGLGDIANKIGGALKTGAKAVGKAIVGKDDAELMIDLKRRAGVRNPENGKPSMAHSEVEKQVDEVDMGQADSSLRNEPKQNNDKMDHFTALGRASKKMGHNHYMDVPDEKLEALRAMVKRFRAGEEVDESALQASFGIKKYGEDGMKKLQQLGREHASEKTKQNTRAEFSDKEKPVAEGSDGYEPIAHAIEQYITKHYNGKSGLDTDDFMKVASMVRNGSINAARKFASTLDTDPRDKLLSMLGQGVAEDLDADQKRVGQLGPTSKVKNNNIGKLVGANENFINTVDQAVVSEMDKSQTPPGRDDDVKGPEGKATPITPKKMADDAKKVLDKQKVKEGQSDLDRILIIMNHRR